uniref:Secreted protein n=1 Tax=Globodera pallida TaxID=36090 RepID=A0A183C959_GLOPA
MFFFTFNILFFIPALSLQFVLLPVTGYSPSRNSTNIQRGAEQQPHYHPHHDNHQLQHTNNNDSDERRDSSSSSSSKTASFPRQPSKRKFHHPKMAQKPPPFDPLEASNV